jgi:peptide-methionine (R)-S-oxide reductase
MASIDQGLIEIFQPVFRLLSLIIARLFRSTAFLDQICASNILDIIWMERRTLLSAAVVLAGAGAYFLLRKPSTMTTTPESFEINKTEEEWRKILTPAQFNVLRKESTERPGSSILDKEYGKGTFACAGCDLPLFVSDTKFNSGTGWPSFYDPIPNSIGTSVDGQLMMKRTEVHCRRCGGHLGHVFEDGPKPTGLRYCMNGISMKFVPG